MIGNTIVYRDVTFTDVNVKSGQFNSECSLTADALGIDTFEFDVISDDTSLTEFQRNAPLRYYHGEKLRGTYYVQDIDRIGSDQYRISGDSAVGLLAQRAHPGGIYTGQTVREVVRDICGAVPVIVESAYADDKLYGWLPYCQPPGRSARDNLVQVLFAIGAYLGTDLNGVLRVEKLWDGVASTVSGDRMYLGGSVKTAAKVSVVSVAEHQYTPGSENAKLYEGIRSTAWHGTVRRHSGRPFCSPVPTPSPACR